MSNKGASGVNTRLIKQCLTYTCSIYSYSPVFHLASLSIVAFEDPNFQKIFEDHSQDFYGWLIVTHFPSQIKINSETGMFLNPWILWAIFFFPSYKSLGWQNSSNSSGAGPSEIMPCWKRNNSFWFSGTKIGSSQNLSFVSFRPDNI